MHRIALLFLCLIGVLVLPLKAQPAWTETDSLTHAMYKEKAWTTVLRETRSSLAEGVDFFFLRSRAGKAAYELGQYRLAVTHFSKAHQWNPDDEFVRYWYYWALIKAGRLDEADALAATFDADFCARNQLKPRGRVHTVSIEHQWTHNGQHNALAAQDITEDGMYMNNRQVLDEQLYSAIGLDHALTDNVNLSHMISYLQIMRTEQFQSELPRVNLSPTNTTQQFSYYIQARWALGRGWKASASATVLWGKSPYHLITFNNNPLPVVTAYEYTISDQMAGISLAWEGSWIKPQLSLMTGFINGYYQSQVSPQLSVFPFGNASFYTTTGLTLHNDEGASKPKQVFNQKIGIKMGSVWLLGEGWLGSIQRFSHSEGYVVYNMPEQINGLAGLSVYVPLFQYRLDVTARYQQAFKDGYTYHFTNTTDYTSRSFHYSEANALIGLTWHF
jgi:tetratricopeptide (TPR) repeat protein